MAKLTEEHLDALAGALSLAARVGGGYEVYGGVNVQKSITAGTEALEILKDEREEEASIGGQAKDVIADAERTIGKAVLAEVAGQAVGPDLVERIKKVNDEFASAGVQRRLVCKECEKPLGYNHDDDCEIKRVTLDDTVKSGQVKAKYLSEAEAQPEQDPPQSALPPLFPFLPKYVYAFTGNELVKFIQEAGGAVSVPFMRAAPDLVFPEDEVTEMLQALTIENAPVIAKAFQRAAPIRIAQRAAE